MTVGQAVAKRIREILYQRDMTQYRLEQKAGMQHGTMQSVVAGRNKTVTLSTVMMVARGLDMSLIEFLDSDIFRSEDLEIE